MSTELIVERRTPLPAPPEAVFAWHVRPGAIERLTPPWVRLQVLERNRSLDNGSRIRFRLRAGLLSAQWTAEHRDVEPGRGFSDVQISGPFDRWVHQHRFEPTADGGTMLHDRIVCQLPMALRLLRGPAEHALKRALAYRHAVTAADLAMHATAPAKRLHVMVSGASGLIGSMLVPLLTTGGHRVTRLVRRPPRPGEVQWDPQGQGLNPAALNGIDAVVHLAGENIGRRWTAARKRAVIASRREGTLHLAQAVARAATPSALISASAIGYYGERGEELLNEESAPGTGFLPEVVTAWEAATEPAAAAGARVARIRIGLLLTPAGGLLQRVLPPFRLGLGGRLGSGRQWMSWISADDLLGVFHHAITSDMMRGAINAVAPHPVRNSGFSGELAMALHRPALLPIPAAALRAAFGQMADEAILASTRVVPEALQQAGHQFRHPTLPAALAHVLGTPIRD